MLLLRLWNYLRGYVIIIVEGYFLEKFINICIHRQIFLWDVNKQKNSRMKLKISINGFKLLRPIARKTRCRVRIAGKKGLPFVLNRYKRRKTFVLGAVLFLLSIYVLTSFVWTIEIHGNNKLETQFLLDKLSEQGVKPGILKYKINTDKLVNEMMINVRELGWIGISVKGTKVKVEVDERVERPDLINKNVPCDIVAARDGIVKTVIAKAGFDVVKPGETVKSGQVLISGKVPGREPKDPYKLVHAIGEVKARTWYEAEASVKVVNTERIRTGNYKDKYSLHLFNKTFNLWNNRVQYQEYDPVEIKKRLTLGEDLVFPFALVIDRFYEIQLVESEMSEEDAKQVAVDAAYKEASGEIPESAEIVKTNVAFKELENGEMLAQVIIECVENIGVTKEIGGN